jgi:cytochrome c553
MSATEETTCGWCHGPHPLPDCPDRPRLSVGSVVAFMVAAMGRPARGWA